MKEHNADTAWAVMVAIATPATFQWNTKTNKRSSAIFNIEEKKDEVVSFDDASEHVEGYAAFVTENPYREELNAFLKQITDRTYIPAWDFEKDKVVLDIIDQIEA